MRILVFILVRIRCLVMMIEDDFSFLVLFLCGCTYYDMSLGSQRSGYGRPDQ